MKAFSLLDALKFGFAKTLENFGTYFLAYLVYGISIFGYIITAVVFLLSQKIIIQAAMLDRTNEQLMANAIPLWQDKVTQNPTFYFIKSNFTMGAMLFLLGLTIAIIVILALLKLGFIKISLDIHDRSTATFSTLFSCWHLVPSSMLLSLIRSTIVGIGFLFFIIPGIYAAIRFGFARQIMVDRNVGAIDALKMSLNLTKGFAGNIFMLYFVLFTIFGAIKSSITILALIISPLQLLAIIYAYRALERHTAIV